MRAKWVVVCVMCLLGLVPLLGGCSGGGPFVPDGNTFLGEFRVAGEVIGTFTFTATVNGVQGIGLMTANGTTQVTIVSTVIGQALDGNMTAATGVSVFKGQFNSETSANGEFGFTDPEENVLAGTWFASVPN